MADGGFQVNPTMVSSISSNMAGLTSHGTGVIGELESLVLDASAFATIGSAVAGSNASLQTQLPNVLKALMQLLGQVNQNVQKANTGYQTADTAVAQSFGGNTTTPAAQPTAAPATTTVHLNPQVVDSIMQSEGASGEQGGVPEAYGFRQNMHNGYDQIMAARTQYGQGSPEERAVVTQLLEQNAASAGALNFTDPGEQAAIMSAAHMRGVGGAHAILNSMVTGDVQQSAPLDPNTVTSLQQLSPTDFQQQFHDARITYDQTVYGNTTTHQGGVTANWWDRYGNGLVNRYDREQQQFQNMSNGN